MEPFQAIFEHGILRPLKPLELNEAEVVSIVITRPDNLQQPAADERRILEQRDAILRFVGRMELSPVNVPADGLSNRDHDRLIYGS